MQIVCSFNILYVCDFITILCRQQAVIIQCKHVNVCNTGQGESIHMKYVRLKVGGGQAYDCSSDSAAILA